MSARRALVIGGSLGGLIVAHLLRATGWDATVFERNDEELASRGVGLGTHPQLIAILKRVIQKSVQDPLAELILSGKIKDGEKVTISAGKQGLVFNGATVAAAA